MDHMELDEEEIFTINSSKDDASFDLTVGHIEDIIMDKHFRKLQNDFMNEYYQHFDDTEENKLIYMDIFKEYNELIEKHLEDQLKLRMPGFSMQEFTHQLLLRKSELDGEVFDMLLTFSDFLAFKEMFLDFRAAKEGRVVDLSGGLSVSSMVPSIVNNSELKL